MSVLLEMGDPDEAVTTHYSMRTYRLGAMVAEVHD